MSTGVHGLKDSFDAALSADHEHDISAFCTLKRTKRDKGQPGILESPSKRGSLVKRFSESSDDLYIGTRVSTVPEPEAYAIQVKKPGTPTEIDLDIEGARQEMDHLHLSVSKPTISEKAWNRLSHKSRRKVKGAGGAGEDGDGVSGGVGNEQKGLSVCTVVYTYCIDVMSISKLCVDTCTSVV